MRSCKSQCILPRILISRDNIHKEISMVKLVQETLDAMYTSQKSSNPTDSEKSSIKNGQSSVVNHETLFFSKMRRNAVAQFLTDAYWEMSTCKCRLSQGDGRSEYRSEAFL